MGSHGPNRIIAAQNRETARWLLSSLAFTDMRGEVPPVMCRGCEHVTRDPDDVLVCILGHGECPKMPRNLRNSAIAEATRIPLGDGTEFAP